MGFKVTTLVVVGTDCTGSCKFGCLYGLVKFNDNSILDHKSNDRSYKWSKEEYKTWVDVVIVWYM
jgi:hypothetical protein